MAYLLSLIAERLQDVPSWACTSLVCRLLHQQTTSPGVHRKLVHGLLRVNYQLSLTDEGHVAISNDLLTAQMMESVWGKCSLDLLKTLWPVLDPRRASNVHGSKTSVFRVSPTCIAAVHSTYDSREDRPAVLCERGGTAIRRSLNLLTENAVFDFQIGSLYQPSPHDPWTTIPLASQGVVRNRVPQALKWGSSVLFIQFAGHLADAVNPATWDPGSPVRHTRSVVIEHDLQPIFDAQHRCVMCGKAYPVMEDEGASLPFEKALNAFKEQVVAKLSEIANGAASEGDIRSQMVPRMNGACWSCLDLRVANHVCGLAAQGWPIAAHQHESDDEDEEGEEETSVRKISTQGEWAEEPSLSLN